MSLFLYFIFPNDLSKELTYLNADLRIPLQTQLEYFLRVQIKISLIFFKCCIKKSFSSNNLFQMLHKNMFSFYIPTVRLVSPDRFGNIFASCTACQLKNLCCMHFMMI